VTRRPFTRARLFRLLCAAAACLLCAACQPPRGGSGVVRIVPRPLSGAAAGQGKTAVSEEQPATRTQRPRISIDPAYTVLQVITVNMDQDADEEQLIAVKRLSDVSSPVHIIIADVDPDRGTYYYQSWEADTNASDSRVFSLSLRDLVGDHGLQIVASGMNDVGRLTLDLFRSLPPSQHQGLVYKPICQLVADDIAIIDADRPDTYSTSQKPGNACAVVATLRDTESSNVLDLVSIRYAWNAADGRYVPGAAEKIPGDQVQQELLRSLFSVSGEEAFERFITGSWIQLQPAPAAKGREAPLAIISFDPMNGKISLSSGNTQEAYIWLQSFRPFPNTLRVIGENEAVAAIKLNRTFTITASSSNAITVTVSGNETIETSTTHYTKVTDEIRDQLIDKPDTHVSLSQLALSGSYTSPSGAAVSFDPPRVTWTDGASSRAGTFLVFSLGTRTILSTRFPRGDRMQDAIISWLVDYSEKKDANRSVRTLSLSPIQLTMNGYEDANGDEISFEQIQVVTQ
jgi:hypothetical protein